MKKSLGKIFGRKTKKRGSSFDLADGTSTPFTPQDLSQDAARSRSKSLFGGTLFKVPLFAAQADDGSLSGLDEKEPEKKEGVPISEKKKTRSTVPVEREAAKVKFPDDMAESSSAAKRNSEAVEESNPGSVRKDEAAVQSESPAAERIDTDELLKVENLKDAHKHLTPAIMLPVVLSYEQIPLLEQTKLPRGGVSIDTKAVGRVQFGLPPETIKDSMRLGIPVPQVYIVPVERFCREMGPALGVNLAEFEFPAYFNFFVYKKRCTLLVDSSDAEENIRRVFSETLLGPAQFLRKENPVTYEPEDFDPSFPKEMIPDFEKEFRHFRIMPDGKELVIETLLDFVHFQTRAEGHSNLGVPPSGDEGLESEDSVCDADALHLVDSDAHEKEEAVPKDAKELESRETKQLWSYSQTRFMGEVAILWPPTATDEEKRNRSVPRVEVFKMPGGTEYVIHDVDVNNHIIGKARISGHVKVSDNLRVDGFGGGSLMEDLKPKISKTNAESSELSTAVLPSIPLEVPPPTFHPPSFGVTVLGNSHGFDASGSTSGFVLWINGRGVMIDPPPYASATLEREGIRPRLIVGIIITHCHADHDAGTFQKILTGSPVVLITTPTIYKSFIRKYAALSALSPALLRHSHRYKAAVIGQPLRFQGATFSFTYSLHTIPCVGFRVEWRGKSIVFTADHFNSPPSIDKLEESGILSKGRADDLRNIPLQDCDLLLHEAGAPPIHTPLEVLMQLPDEVKKRLYVVHTAKLPDGCDLRAAPTGTAGTLRLDGHRYSSTSPRSGGQGTFSANQEGEYATVGEDSHTVSPARRVSSYKGRSSVVAGSIAEMNALPLVALRPASSTDAWFILNLLSAVPFISSLSYSSTMELLETARVDAYSQGDVIIPASRRNQVLCVVWEGTCSEKLATDETNAATDPTLGVWHAGDWSGPAALQPDRKLNGESKTSATHDIVAVSYEGVKVITVEFSSLRTILMHGSALYKTYLERTPRERNTSKDKTALSASNSSDIPKTKDLNVLELLNCNSALRKLSAVQKRHVESLAEGPVIFQPYERMWQAGAAVDKAFIIVSGTASFHGRRSSNIGTASHDDRDHSASSDPLADSVRGDAMKLVKELDRAAQGHLNHDDVSDMSSVEMDENRQFPLELFGSNGHDAGITEANDFNKVIKGLQARADHLANDDSVSSSHGDEIHECEAESRLAPIFIEGDPGTVSRRSSVMKRRGSRARFANKVLGRLYNRRTFTSGLVFSRGHFLGDVSKMVAGFLASDETLRDDSDSEDGDGPSYGFGDKKDVDDDKKMGTITEMTHNGSHLTVHNSTLTAGTDGCVALVFPKSTLTPLLDEYPGLLLSLLGTQVVV